MVSRIGQHGHVQAVEHRPIPGYRWLTFGALLLAPLVLTNCSRADCSKSTPTDTIVGRLSTRRGSTATFSIASVRQSSTQARSAPYPPALTSGQTVSVQYFGDHAKFLRIGSTYLVDVYWVGYFRSDVHVSSDPCSGGTVYADGKSIDTASWTRSHVSEIVALFAAVPLILLVVLATAIGLRRRARRVRL